MHPENRRMVNNTMIEPTNRAGRPYEAHATTRAVAWARRVYGE